MRSRSETPLYAMTIGVVVLALASGCSVMRWTTSVSRDYDYLGGIELGPLEHENGLTTVPLRIDPMAGELWMDSAQTLYDAPHEVDGDTIYFGVRTCLASTKSSKERFALRVPGLEPGVYKVVFRGPERLEHDLGEITVPAE